MGHTGRGQDLSSAWTTHGNCKSGVFIMYARALSTLAVESQHIYTHTTQKMLLEGMRRLFACFTRRITHICKLELVWPFS